MSPTRQRPEARCSIRPKLRGLPFFAVERVIRSRPAHRSPSALATLEVDIWGSAGTVTTIFAFACRKPVTCLRIPRSLVLWGFRLPGSIVARNLDVPLHWVSNPVSPTTSKQPLTCDLADQRLFSFRRVSDTCRTISIERTVRMTITAAANTAQRGDTCPPWCAGEDHVIVRTDEQGASCTPSTPAWSTPAHSSLPGARPRLVPAALRCASRASVTTATP